jgi:pimeloyl-ACP methyl ester carboxylesterase
MPFLKVGDLNMHYHVRGKGPPLVLIMGLSGDLTWWERLAALLDTHFRLVLFDNRGAGLTDKPEEKYSIGLFASDTIGLMDALGVSRAHMFGVSMGGMIAQEVALRYPGRVERLALGCTHSGGQGFIMPSPEAIQKMTLTRPGEVPRGDRPADHLHPVQPLFPGQGSAVHRDHGRTICAQPS